MNFDWIKREIKDFFIEIARIIRSLIYKWNINK